MSAKQKKQSAADRTVDMFAAPQPMEERPVEIVEEDAHQGERVSVEEDADHYRDAAFKFQEWTTKAFGKPEAEGNEYRVTYKAQHYYVETIRKTPGAATAYGYVGIMVHESDLFSLTAVLVQAVRAKQDADKRQKEASDARHAK